MASNVTSYELPPLPEYTLKPLQPLVSWASDAAIQTALPVIAYWAVSLIFHTIDVYDLFARYRLHTPAEVLKRNHVTRWEVFRDVVLQQVIQSIALIGLSYYDDAPTTGTAEYDVAWYAQKLRLAQRAIPFVLSTIGINPTALASKLSAAQPTLAAVVAGGRYPGLPAFASWELNTAGFLYWYAVPAVQFMAAIIIIDAWEYMLHRAMHMNKWLYVTFHSRHHRLYVPYAYGALYNHPLEGFALDTLGGGLGYLLTGLTLRQSMWFFTGSTIKTVLDHSLDGGSSKEPHGLTLRQSMWFFTGSTIKTVLDHSGYEFPYDPLHYIFPNNAAYHDIHHQSWGIKTNFSQPFFVYLDRIGGTMYKGDTASKYERARRTAQEKFDQEKENELNAVLADAATSDESLRAQGASTPRISRKKALSISSSAGNFKDLTNKVNQNLHGRGAGVLRAESSR